jgi:hypothetical protein
MMQRKAHFAPSFDGVLGFQASLTNYEGGGDETMQACGDKGKGIIFRDRSS